MAEYIKRKDVLRHKRKMRCTDFRGGFWDFIVQCEDIERIPAADVEEVRHGEWIGHEGYEECNNCHHKALFCHKYCPNCGAKMDGGEDNENTGNS